MRNVLKWTAIGVGGLLGIGFVAAVALFFAGGARINRSYDIAVAAVAVPTDDSTIARGRHLAHAVTLCEGCHGENLAGDTLIDEPMIATIYASNLTSGRGGVGLAYNDADYTRAIRHGVNKDGRGLMIMHSDAYHHLGEADLGALIAYVKSVPPVDHVVPKTRGGVLGRIFVALGMFDTETMPLISAELIDHDAPFVPAPPRGVTAAYGQYLMSIALCAMCHGSALQGGPPIEEGAPPAPNIVGYAASGGWSPEQFVTTIRSGITPFGKALNPEVMPWEVYANMTDEELGAIWQYMMSLNGR